MTVGSFSVDTRGPRVDAFAYRQTITVAILTLFGLALRLAAARGDLWLDEIWTLRLLEGVPSFAAIFFALPYDNNHLLNSAWLAIVGPDASPLLARWAAVLFGTLCIPIAARLGARRHALAGTFAAAIVSVDGILVHFASEARGYSGMILGLFLTLDRLEAILDDPGRRTPLLVLGAAVAFGTLSHLTMIAASGVLGATAAIRVLMQEGWTRSALRRIGAIAAAILGGTLPALVCVGISLSGGILHTGAPSPFTWPMFTIGMGRMAAATLGLPDGYPGPFFACAVMTGIGAAGLAFVSKDKRVFPALAMFGLPAAQALLRVPSEEYARFHLVSSIGLLVLAIDVVARATQAGVGSKAATLVVTLLVMVGQGTNLTRFLSNGRGAFREPVALMGAKGPAMVIVQPAYLFGETSAVITWYAGKTGARITTVRPGCAVEAQWLLIVREPNQSLDMPREQVSGPGGCGARFALQSTYTAYGLSGFSWVLFHREPQSSALR